MIQATGSGAGKSLTVAALCRIFADMGLRVAPFKSQNMALNSYITSEGGEIGRAQALQAEAAKVPPSVHMNPILLKASGDAGVQVIVHGKVLATMSSREYYRSKKTLWRAVEESYHRLSSSYDLIVIEGAGSPAEINLMDVDIANMAVAELAGAAVLLVGDIDRGGVFASLYGTVELLGRYREYVKGFIINKFRGDLEILKPGLEMLTQRTGVPVIGVVPWIDNIGLPEEDGLCIPKDSIQASERLEGIKTVVLRLKYISNFTDFDPFLYEPDVELLYSDSAVEIENADVVIIPGSKNTVKDLLYLKQKGLMESILRAYHKGVEIVGLCGGYQMLSKKIFDPEGVESAYPEVEGIGLLDIETIFDKEKITSQVSAEPEKRQTLPYNFQGPIRGYEIHMGRTRGAVGLFRLRRLTPGREPRVVPDGSRNHNCWGTYIHGIFDNDDFRRSFINYIRQKKGLKPLQTGIAYSKMKEIALNRLADLLRAKLDIEFILRQLRL